MGWPKGKKKSDVDVREVEPVEVPEVISASEVKNVCRGCGHDEKIHYEGRDKQCNKEGCRCAHLTK